MDAQQPTSLSLDDREVRELRDRLAAFDPFGGVESEGMAYLDASLRRFLITLSMIPPAPTADSRLLELGAAPFYFSLMLKWYHRYQLSVANYFTDPGPSGGRGEQVVASTRDGERHTFIYEHFNSERDPFPYPDGHFDVVLCCEILEHLTVDPSHMLYEIHRVLKPGGHLLLTTPNVLAWRNLWRLAIGQNTADSYSGYGAYGRHNREYTPREVIQLLQTCNFEILSIRLEDIYRHRPFHRLLKQVRKHWRDNIFVLAQAHGRPCYAYPAFLYRSVQGHALHHIVDSRIVAGQHDETQLGQGWYPAELETRHMRWTGGRASIYLRRQDGQRFFNLEIDPMAATLGPVTLTVTIGAENQEFKLASDGSQVLRVPLPPALPAEFEVVLTVTPIRIPARLGLNADTRPLGVAVRQAWLD